MVISVVAAQHQSRRDLRSDNNALSLMSRYLYTHSGHLLLVSSPTMHVVFQQPQPRLGRFALPEFLSQPWLGSLERLKFGALIDNIQAGDIQACPHFTIAVPVHVSPEASRTPAYNVRSLSNPA